MKTAIVQRQDRSRRPEMAGFHTLQGRLALQRALARLKHRLANPRFIEAPHK